MDSIIVTIAGSPSGIAATASPTEVINISSGVICFKRPIKNIKMQIPKHAHPNIFPTSSNFFWIGVCGVSFVMIILAILPTFVSIPISVTIPSPCPSITIVLPNAVFIISPIEHFSPKIAFASFDTPFVSPVKLDSSIFNSQVFKSLQSAGT